MSKKITDKHFISREISWLSFNSRVLDQAFDKNNPLLEQLKFMAIFSNNLDEFFMVRVAGLRQQYEANDFSEDPAGLTTEEQLNGIRAKTKLLVRRQYGYLKNHMLPELGRANIHLVKINKLDNIERERLKLFFEKDILPVLTPVGFDPTHPFPVINNLVIEIAVRVRRPNKKEDFYGFVEVPSSLTRFISVNYSKPGKAFILLEDLVLEHIDMLFSGCTLESAFPFRITKDMDFSIEDIEEDSNLMIDMEKKLRSSRKRKAIRLELPEFAKGDMSKWLIEKLAVPDEYIYEINGPLNLANLFELISLSSTAKLIDSKIEPLKIPILEDADSIFDVISHLRAIPLFHPYESFNYVVKFLRQAAEDPNVLAIKQTLYRVSGDSPIVHSLQKAAENGKQVTVIVELKARFDEKRNIAWAKRLEMSGAHVIYGMSGLKIHCKALLIVRREEGGIRRYLHLATGNYNDSTARIYTDTGMFLTDTNICADISALFNVMTGYSEPPNWKNVAVAPFNLREKFIKLIDREARNSTKHKPGRIVAKMNSLVDKQVIQHLYKAAYAGVKIDLIVRGICCLRPGVETRNINVISIVDRYLEHSRIFYFENTGNHEYYMSSADWMPRNLDKRIELLFPIEDKFSQSLIAQILKAQLNDTFNGRKLGIKGNYPRYRVRDKATRSQLLTYDILNEYRPLQGKIQKFTIFEKER
ncbi:MAG TPA: polyphosphate kinase 1 [Victivallales bacterium]|nr:polyphosphate kinase 1 [Victivallales bacterium]